MKIEKISVPPSLASSSSKFLVPPSFFWGGHSSYLPHFRRLRCKFFIASHLAPSVPNFVFTAIPSNTPPPYVLSDHSLTLVKPINLRSRELVLNTRLHPFQVTLALRFCKSDGLVKPTSARFTWTAALPTVKRANFTNCKMVEIEFNGAVKPITAGCAVSRYFTVRSSSIFDC